VHSVGRSSGRQNGIATPPHYKFLYLSQRIHLNDYFQGYASRASMAFQGLPEAMLKRRKNQIKLLNIAQRDQGSRRLFANMDAVNAEAQKQ
jgi:hypothetical protein